MPKAMWSNAVTRNSNALDLEKGVFTWDDPEKIARSLKASADKSDRRKASPFVSAMSMLNFYLNRAGKNLPAPRKRTLTRAKVQLRRLYGRVAASHSRAGQAAKGSTGQGRASPKSARGGTGHGKS